MHVEVGDVALQSLLSCGSGRGESLQQRERSDSDRKERYCDHNENERGKELLVAELIGRRRLIFFETKPEEPEYEGFALAFFFGYAIFVQRKSHERARGGNQI